MTVKSLKKQLVAAIAMVLVSVLALSSATFAWFANNNKVTADGLKISAAAEGSLLIIADTEANLLSGDLAHKTSYAFAMTDAAELYPTHPSKVVRGAAEEGSAIVWNHRFSEDYTTAITEDSDDEVEVSSDDLDKYVLTKKLAIGVDTSVNENAAVGAVTVSKVTITGASDEFLPCARVAIVDESGKLVGVYAPGNKYVSTFNDQTAPDVATGDMATAGHGQIISKLDSTDKATTITVYVYFDGRDDACTSEKFDATAVSVALEFTSAPATVTP